MSEIKEQASFHRMTEATAEDWRIIDRAEKVFNRSLADRVLAHLGLLKGDLGGYAVDRLEHSLQSASMAYRGGEDEEYVVCALLHDIGDTLASYNHAELAATVLQPFVSEANHWLLTNHGVFQGYYFFQFYGLDRDIRERFRGHPHFERTADFCERYDQTAFDPNYDTLPLELFEPMVRRVMAAPKRSIYLPENAADER